MIYDYYCTNCGHKFSGKEVVFDLAQILDLHSGNSENLFIKFTPEDLRELAERNGAVLADGKRIRLKLSLFDLLGYMAQDLPSTVDQEAMQELTYEEFEQVTAMSNLLKSGNLQNSDVQKENVKALVDSIIAKLEQEEKTDPEISEEVWNQNTANYSLYFWVQPVYFEGTEDIYTILYSCERTSANLSPLSFSKVVIRGYCPVCNQPILKGSGRYEHILVGFLGAQSAGKTSLFVSMVNNLPKYYEEMDIKSAEILADGKYSKINEALKLNAQGWAVKKTDAKAITEAYNASLLISKKNDNKKVILSLIDIAGELCYDQVTQSVSLDALNKFPLITSCHLYMLCTCVSQNGFGQNDNNRAKNNIPPISNMALMNIITGIYQLRVNNEDKLSVPPMAIVITKVDMAVADTQVSEGNTQDNPFSRNNLPELRFHESENGAAFNLKEQIDHLRDIYASTSDKNILEALQWCQRTYRSKSTSTYITFLPCSALGMEGRIYEGDMNNIPKGDDFKSMKLDVVWSWILCNIGMRPVYGNYCLPYIPSYGEGIILRNMPQGNFNVRLMFNQNQEEERTKAVYQLYLNASDFDRELFVHHIGAMQSPWWNFLGLRDIQAHERERITIIRRYLEAHSNKKRR